MRRRPTAGAAISWHHRNRRRGLLAAAILIWSLLAASLARADNYLLLDRDEDAAQIRIDLIRGAHTSIDATYFIVGKDGVALSVLAELRAASRRGIPVRMIIDARRPSSASADPGSRRAAQ